MTDRYVNDYCEGCLVLSISSRHCSYSKYNDDGRCPCCTCIVKVMCNETCEKFEAFRENKLEGIGGR